MRLEDKGPIVPPPKLKGPSQKVSLEVQSWDRIVSATHWTIGDSTKSNGADFYVGKKELGHIHLDGEIHLVLTKALAAKLIKANLAEAFPHSDAWVQFLITDKATAQHGIWLFQLSFDRLSGTSVEQLFARIENHRAS